MLRTMFEPDERPPTLRGPWVVLLAMAAFACCLFVSLALLRLTYPFELEWMEGAMADHSHRVATGQALYCAPTSEHVPFLYAPLLFWLGGLASKFGFAELTALRAIAGACSLGTAMLIGHWVRVATQRVSPGLTAMGLFLAGYGWLWWWYDLARNDSLFLLCVLGCAYALRHTVRWRIAKATLLAVLAVLAKQSAVMWLPAIAVGALCWEWRVGLQFCIAAGLACAATLLGLSLATDGWAWFYLFEMPRHHGIDGSRYLGFWTEDLLPMLPTLLLGLLGFLARMRQRPRSALFLAAFGCGGLMTSWLSRLHVGGFDNVMMYGFAAACVLGPAAMRGKNRRLELLGAAFLAVQFALLFAIAWQRSPTQTALPNDAHRTAHANLRAYVQNQRGNVFLPGHGGVTRDAGQPSSAHGQAIFDLLQALPRTSNGQLDLGVLLDEPRLNTLPPRAALALRSFRDSMYQALRDQRLAAIVLDAQLAPSFEALFAFALVDLYRRREQPVIPNGPTLRPLVGFAVDSPHALERAR